MGAAMRLTSIECSFHLCNIYRDCPRTGEAKMCKKIAKMTNFWTYGLNYWETVEDRWVHAAMRLTILFSSMWHLPRLSQGRTHERPKCALGWLQKLTHVYNWRYSHPSCCICSGFVARIDVQLMRVSAVIPKVSRYLITLRHFVAVTVKNSLHQFVFCQKLRLMIKINGITSLWLL